MRCGILRGMKEERKEPTTVVELERETVRELRLMLRLYFWNTAFTFLSAVAGWVAITVMLWMLLNR